MEHQPERALIPCQFPYSAEPCGPLVEIEHQPERALIPQYCIQSENDMRRRNGALAREGIDTTLWLHIQTGQLHT